MKRMQDVLALVVSGAAVLGPGAPAASADPLRLKAGDRIVALGDSITQGGGYLRFMKKVLDRHYPDLKIEIVNAGISGHKSPDMSERLKRDVIDKNPTIVTISCGVNDVWHGFYNPPRGVDLETYTRLMAKMVDDVRAQTKAEIYLLTPTIIHEDLRSPENAKMEAYCDAVRALAAEKGCRLVDLNDLFNLGLRGAQMGGGADFHPTRDGVHMKPAGDFWMGAAILRAMGVPLGHILDVTVPASPAISAGDPKIQYWGRWDLRDAAKTGAVTVNTGSTIVAAFETIRGMTAHFEPRDPAPSLWVRIDDGEWKVVAVDETVPLAAGLPLGNHTVRIVVKGLSEWKNRWEPPLESCVVFRGFSVAGGEDSGPPTIGVPPPRPAKLVEYLGDSITEGVLVDFDPAKGPWAKERWPQSSDGRRTWAYQSAVLIGAEPRTVGFGRLGLTIGGNGGVPPASYSFGQVFGGAPLDTGRAPDAVVINLGTNDGGASKEVFAPLVRAYVARIRQAYPKAAILCLRPFNGAHGETLAEVAKSLADAGDPLVRFVDTSGWIDPKAHCTDGVHLNLEGNRVAAEKLAAVLKTVLGGE